MKSREIRKEFLNFFLQKEHSFVKPVPVVPQNDPTILFINAGMNQFKDILLGIGKRDYSRAVNSQVCIRVSGKHNDLEEVGLDTTHLTSFEMLGNWSFGDYYKKEAIVWAWDLFTNIFKISKNKLYATYFETDQESADLWKKETDINPKQILKFGKKDNFWEMGIEGPCGPCSEIHIDLGEDACDKKNEPNHICAVNGTCHRFVELWNLVFIQYNRLSNGNLEDLPNKHIDTGAGLERITAYLQNTTSVYETDLFKPIIKKIIELTGRPYDNSENGMAHRVISDHIRTVTFAIADNVLPSNEGRGYVLRRILRRAIRFGKKLGINKPLLYKLVNTVIDVMSCYLEDLPKRKDFIETIIKSEEKSFLRTLEAGINIFETLAQNLIKENKTEISGSEAFKLYDTYGFPLDLTQLMAREKNLSVNVSAFQKELDTQKDRSRKSKKTEVFDGSKAPIGGEARLVHDEDDKLKMARHHTATHLLHSALREVLGEHVTQAGSLVDLHRLRFDFSHYQAVSKEELKIVEDLVKEKVAQDIKLEKVEMPLEKAKKTGALSLFGEKYQDRVNVVSISDFSKELCGGNHLSSTGEVQDFKIISEGAISAGVRRIEAIAGTKNIEVFLNKKKDNSKTIIKKDLKQIIKITETILIKIPEPEIMEDVPIKSLEELVNFIPKQNNVYPIKKILTIFSVGKIEKSPDTSKYSQLENVFVSNLENIIAKKIFWSELITLISTLKFTSSEREFWFGLAEFVKWTEFNLGQKSLDEFKEMEIGVAKIKKLVDKKANQLKENEASTNIKDYLDNIKSLKEFNINLLPLFLNDYDIPMLRTLSDNLVNMKNKLIVILASKRGENGFFLVKLSNDLAGSDYSAQEIINFLTKITGGQGGGRPDMAQAGGIDPGKIKTALSEIESFFTK